MIMANEEFLLMARQNVVDYFNSKADKTDEFELKFDNTFVVWYSWILGNQKCLISTTMPDGMYYEVTFDRDRGKIYLDAYKKWENKEIEVLE